MFVCRTKDNSETAYRYLCGLLQSERRNMERMEEVVAGADHQALQQFITDSPWDERALLDRLADEANAALGGMAESSLLIDESCFSKKGLLSVGVARQWNGRLGKRDQCQVGVFAGLSAGDRATLIDVRLYLPAEWIDDPARCRAAGVPASAQVFRTKCELALEMVRAARHRQLGFRYVRADAGYGNSWAFLHGLHADGERFLVDLPDDRLIYCADPAPALPPPGRGGRRPREPIYHSAQSPVKLRDYAATLPADQWAFYAMRRGTKGTLRAAYHHRRIWCWQTGTATACAYHLLIRRDADGRLSYAISNAPADTPLSELIHVHVQRIWIERSFEDAKSHLGLAHYQVRGWRAWHHHMAMCLLGMWLLLRHRLVHTGPLLPLTVGELRYLLDHFLTHPYGRPERPWARLKTRQRKRQAAMAAAATKQAASDAQCPVHVIDLTK